MKKTTKKKIVKGRKPSVEQPSVEQPNGMVVFNFANVSYQIDPTRRKVYHRWVEVETAKTCLIMGAWSQTQAPQKQAV